MSTAAVWEEKNVLFYHSDAMFDIAPKNPLLYNIPQIIFSFLNGYKGNDFVFLVVL